MSQVSFIRTTGFLGAILIILLNVAAVQTQAQDQNEWPPVKPGIWKITTVEKLPHRRKKPRSRIRKRCARTEWWFRAYFGSGIIKEAGCHFASEKKSANSYQITTTCEIEKLGQGVSQGIVTLRSDDEYVATIETREGGHLVSLKEVVGKRLKACP